MLKMYITRAKNSLEDVTRVKVFQRGSRDVVGVVVVLYVVPYAKHRI
jgi:hypothetical protein